uniref:PRA1 family protein n=1 Tax=Rhizophora mucronata TaxID=61149 RepID=A0A2P2PKR4_RHIMU
MPNTPQFLSTFKQTAQSLAAGSRPWSVFLDISSFNLPSSVADATTRVSQNLSHFAVNYAVIFLLVLLFSLLAHPLSIVAFLLLLSAWVFLYFAREEPLRVFGFEVGDLAVLICLVAATVVVLVWSGVWLNILVGSAIGVVLVGVHAVLRGTDDLVADDFDPAPYGNLLSDEESPRLGL